MKTFAQFVSDMIDYKYLQATPDQIFKLKDLCLIRGVELPYSSLNNAMNSLTMSEVDELIRNLSNEINWSYNEQIHQNGFENNSDQNGNN